MKISHLAVAISSRVFFNLLAFISSNCTFFCQLRIVRLLVGGTSGLGTLISQPFAVISLLLAISFWWSSPLALPFWLSSE
jgi:hypothetical protein